jgi:hypothetical protein
MNIRFTRTGRLAGLCLTLILLFGACDNPADGDDENTVTATAAQDAADQFYAGHSAILEKPVALIVLGDEETINAALKAYRDLRSEVRALLAAEKSHLDRLKVQIETLKTARANGVFYTAVDLGAWLAEQPENSAGTPYPVIYTGNETIKTIYSVLLAEGRYAALDLSASGVRGFDVGNEEGRAFIVSLVLPDSLTEIPNGFNGNVLFQGFTNLKTLSAAGVRSVGEFTFAGCGSLEAVSLPKAETIGYYAFQRCTLLAMVDLPEVVTIDGYAFSQCTNLGLVTLPKARSLRVSAFAGCSKLTSISLPQMGYLDMNAFSGTGLTEITLPKVNLIRRGSLSTPSLTTVTLGFVPPAIESGGIFSGLVSGHKTITIHVPNLELYKSVGTPWSDKVNMSNQGAGYFWSNIPATRDNLTVNLVALSETELIGWIHNL